MATGEIFRTPDGTPVATGLVMPNENELLLMAAVAEMPDRLYLDAKDIERALVINGEQRYKQDRKKRQKRMRNQSRLGKCFPAGTLVRMADGSQKPIQDVRVLDQVLTAEGRVRTVVKTMVRPHAGSLLRVCVWGNRHIRCTAEHPFLTKNGYKAAEDLKEGDWLAIPRFAPQSVSIIEPWQILKQKQPVGVKNERKLVQAIGRITKKIPGKSPSFEHRVPMPELIELDRDFGWVLGLFMAEGALNYSKIQFCLAKHEVDTIAAKLCDILLHKFGIEATVVVRNNECQVKWYGADWAKLLEALVSHGCAEKNLSPLAASGPREFLEGVLQGWQDGDGLGSPGYGGGVTVSHRLAMNMYDIATFLGHEPRIETLDVKINPKHKIKERRLRYIVKWPSNPVGEKQPRFESTEKVVWRKFHKTEPEPFSGWVYNLEVEDDHSYVAEGLGVHNCNASSNCSAAENVRDEQGMPEVALSDCHLYSGINGGSDNGSALISSMKKMQDDGCSPMEVQVGGMTRVMPNDVYNRRNFDREVLKIADQEAARFKGMEYYKAPIDSFEKFAACIASAIARRFQVIFAWHVGGSSMRLNGNGYAVVGRGAGNHSNCLHSGKWVGGKSLVHPDDQNSWGPSVNALFGPTGGQGWGEGGFALFTMEDVFACARNHCTYIVPTLKIDPNDPAFL